MSESQSIASSIGRLVCGDEFGTAFYVGNGFALTCRHCVISHLLDADVPILITFGERVVEACLAENDFPIGLDIVLLVLSMFEDRFFDALPLVVSHLPRGLEWITFGFPRVRRDEGMWLEGKK